MSSCNCSVLYDYNYKIYDWTMALVTNEVSQHLDQKRTNILCSLSIFQIVDPHLVSEAEHLSLQVTLLLSGLLQLVLSAPQLLLKTQQLLENKHIEV